jgi:class 3 adenylate cyclase
VLGAARTIALVSPGEIEQGVNAGGSTGAATAGDRRSYTPDRLAERMLAAGRALEGERKLVTVLFADVVGSMGLAEGLGPEDWRRVMDRCLAILCEGCIASRGWWTSSRAMA